MIVHSFRILDVSSCYPRTDMWDLCENVFSRERFVPVHRERKSWFEPCYLCAEETGCAYVKMKINLIKG